MAAIEKRRVSCPIKHVAAFIIKDEDGSFVVKCSLSKACGEDCPYLRNPDYKAEYRRAPDFKAR